MRVFDVMIARNSSVGACELSEASRSYNKGIVFFRLWCSVNAAVLLTQRAKVNGLETEEAVWFDKGAYLCNWPIIHG